MNRCPIAQSISIHCDEPEQLSSSEILNKLLKDETVCINGISYELFEITDKIDIEQMREAFQDDVLGNDRAVLQVYLTVILEMMK